MGQLRQFAGGFALALACGLAGAAEFSVSPIHVVFERGARSALVTVTNDDARPLRMQLRLTEWSQDAQGQDVYKESDDLIYFPKMMTIEPKEKRLVRIGIKSAPGATERTYRLFLHEQADPAKPAASGLTFSLSFALPIFVAPAESRLRGEIEAVTLDQGKLRVTVSNPGNQHFRIESVKANGGKLEHEVGGWYLLAGKSRTHMIDIPPEECRGVKRLAIKVTGAPQALERALEVEPGMCKR